jgi:predicted Rossmann fold nucleotide-binding protein DprA/Smf involved in DNA uptake
LKLGDRTFSLFLAMTPYIGGRTLVRILTTNELLGHSNEDFLALSQETLKERYRLTDRAASSLVKDQKTRLNQTVELEKKLSGLGVQWVTSFEALYPSLIETMDPNPPGVLFLYGNSRLLDSKTFCVMCSRNPMSADLDLIERLTEEGILQGEVLVSGQNNSSYQRSAVVPLRWGAPRILCVDKGLFDAMGKDLKKEGFSAARLWRYEFDPETDLVVSPFRPDDKYIGANNRVRDLLIACLSHRLDFVNISESGNMQRISRLALKAGRTVRVSDRIVGYRSYLALGASVIPE